MERIKLVFVVVFCLFCFSCAMNFDKEKKVARGNSTVSFACWNTQTFFDAEVDGTEYDEFKNLSKWSKEKYMTRLGRLCEVMTTLNADVFVLEEIENKSVVQDIANRLAGSDWNKNNTWRYACFAKDEGAAIGCALFSKYEITGVRTHSVCVKNLRINQPSMRPIIEVTLNVDGKVMTVFVNHWKSKLGDENTDIWRDWQEFSCANKVADCILDDSARICVLCGDFNRDVNEFCCSFDSRLGNTNFRAIDGCVRLYSPWLTDSGGFVSERGSYYYDGTWERIDNILVTENVHLSAFSSRADLPWATSSGIPIEYSIYTGKGYSDHLPLMCVLTF